MNRLLPGMISLTVATAFTALFGPLFSTTLVAEAPPQEQTKVAQLAADVPLEVVYIPPGHFLMGSTDEEKIWAVSQDGGALFSSGNGVRENYEGSPRPMQVKDGFWMGRTAVTVGQFRTFVEATNYVSDAEQPEGVTNVFDQDWKPNITHSGSLPNPWIVRNDKSWRDPNYATPQLDSFPVVCVSYNDMNAFCKWLTETEKANGRLPEGLVYRLPTEAEWEYACRGGSKESHYYWWGSNLDDAKGRLNISGLDLLPGKDYAWPGAKLPWQDGYAMVSPVDHYGARGRNGFGLADMCGGVWEFVIDHFDPTGGHEEVHYEDAATKSVSHPVCRGGNYYDVPGNARIAVRLGIHSPTYSDSRDGFRVCLGLPK
ncbi:formylglycine-generating enzyme family protein [Planctomicrobium sp. SH668]|uniref:formylglycine-generating enzyme family protein n=1 Tax=Planctomicrobium sp. SH668 TaxID=3448126 RepID=UPI003F5B302B